MPGWGAAVAAVISRATPTVSVLTPTQSIRVSCPLSRGTTRRVRISTPTVIGISAPKMARQPKASATRPPTGGPIAWPMPFAAPQAPITRLRCCGAKLRASVPMTATGTAAHPRPCRPRLTTSRASVGATRGPDRADEQHDEREHERAPAAQAVADPACEGHGDGEHDDRRRGHQHALGHRRIEIGDDLPQRHVDDVVADGAEHRRAEQGGEQPAPPGRGSRRRGCAGGRHRGVRPGRARTRRRLRHGRPLVTLTKEERHTACRARLRQAAHS